MNNKTSNQNLLSQATQAIRGAQEKTAYQEHNQALFLTSSFTWNSAEEAKALFSGEQSGFTYSRTSNPTVSAFAKRIALLEDGEQGVATATGMAAIQAALLTFLSAGDHLICSQSLFGTTLGFLNNHVKRFGIEISFVSQTNPEEWRNALQPNTKMLFLETPSNPLSEIADLEALAEIAHDAGALLVVDNSFCTPAVQQPLKHGADLSVQSATKAIDGHGRVQGGIVVGNSSLMKEVQQYMNAAGISLSPFHAWVLLSGVETLPLRMKAQSEASLKLAEWLQKQPQVKSVYYAGLPEHPQAHLVAKQQNNGGKIVAFEVTGEQEGAWKVIDSVAVFSRTANLGDVRSTITHPWTTTHGKLAPDAKIDCGIMPGLIRLSIGLENVDDLIADLAQALEGLSAAE